MSRIERSKYVQLYGPTEGDRIRLGDTELWIQVEKDHTCGGDEVVFGGGKSIRESQAQGTKLHADHALDVVITNVVVLDHWGIVRGDVGIRDGHIVAVGKAGNPEVMDHVTEGLVIGPSTDVIAGEGKILTAGAVDSHVHFLSESELDEALASGITTVIGGGTGPTEGSKATTVTPGPNALRMMHRALDRFPLNVLLFSKGNTRSAKAMQEDAMAGAGGYKVHEDWGATPKAIEAALEAADTWGLQVALHADSLNETGFVGDTLAAIDGKSIHIFHSEGAGGGHAPDIIKVASAPSVLPASTNPTLPFTVNTVDEHLDMLMVVHHLNPKVPEDLAFAESRIRASTMGAEDILQDMGAISITSTDAQAMGRIGELICRTWQVAHAMKLQRGACCPGCPDKRDESADAVDRTDPADNCRAKRYVAKYTICPAKAHGIDHKVGSVEPEKMADLVLWDPAFFGIRPAAVIKSGAIVLAPLGDPNGAVPMPQPVLMRQALAARASSAADLSVTFVSKKVLEMNEEEYKRNGGGVGDDKEKTTLKSWLGLRRTLVGVEPTRDVRKKDMPNNTATPTIDVDPNTFDVSIDGELVRSWPVDSVPLAQRYSLF